MSGASGQCTCSMILGMGVAVVSVTTGLIVSCGGASVNWGYILAMSRPERLHTRRLARGPVMTGLQRRFDLGGGKEVHLAGIGGDQQGLGARGFHETELLVDIVGYAGKPLGRIGERDHE